MKTTRFNHICMLALSALVGLALFAASSHAATLAVGDVIALDLGTSGDGGGTAGATTDWNQIASGANITIAGGSVIRHGDGAVVDGVTINVTAGSLVNTGQNDDSRSAGWSGLAGDPYYNDEAFTDLVYAFAPGSLTVTFGGLDPSLSYNLRTYALINEGLANFNLTVTDGAGSIVRSNLNRSALYAIAPLSSDLIFAGISPNGSNNISVTISSTQAVSFQAVVLEVIPEPSSVALLCLGGLPLLLRRRRSA